MNPFGQISPPPGVTKGVTQGGLTGLISTVLNLPIVVAGLYMILNLILAGYQFINAAGDAKTIESAWHKIWQSVVGLVLVAGSFTLAALFGQLIFGDPTAILNPKIFTP
jgi:hypothetical protein